MPIRRLSIDIKELVIWSVGGVFFATMVGIVWEGTYGFSDFVKMMVRVVPSSLLFVWGALIFKSCFNWIRRRNESLDSSSISLESESSDSSSSISADLDTTESDVPDMPGEESSVSVMAESSETDDMPLTPPENMGQERRSYVESESLESESLSSISSVSSEVSDDYSDDYDESDSYSDDEFSSATPPDEEVRQPIRLDRNVGKERIELLLNREEELDETQDEKMEKALKKMREPEE